MTPRRYTQDETTEAIAALRDKLTPGRTVYTKITHVSRSGMSRSIEAYLAEGRDNLTEITWLVARATNSRIDHNHGGLIMGGGGMDMGFALVYGIGRTLYPEGVPCTGRNHATATARVHVCRSNDHVNYHSLPYSRGKKHRDGGYAYRQEWL